MARPVVRAVFALLVVATIAAFFVTQQLKSEFPLVIRFSATPKQFSPNGDRYRDSAQVGFDLSEPAKVTFSIMDGEGNEIRRLVDDRQLAGDVVRRFRGDGRGGVWHGEVATGPEETGLAPDGDYAFTVSVRDKAGNLAVAPAEIPSAASARAGTGVSVRSFTLSGPLEVVAAGAVAEFEAGPIDQSLDFVVSRLGNPKPLRRGGRIAGRFRVRIPSDAKTGVYVARVR